MAPRRLARAVLDRLLFRGAEPLVDAFLDHEGMDPPQVPVERDLLPVLVRAGGEDGNEAILLVVHHLLPERGRQPGPWNLG